MLSSCHVPALSDGKIEVGCKGRCVISSASPTQSPKYAVPVNTNPYEAISVIS